MSKETYHCYVAFCGKHLYEKYGHLIESLLLRHIFVVGLEEPDGVRGDDDHVYHHGLIVMSSADISPELAALFPEIAHDRWHHDERTKEALSGPIAPTLHPFAIRI